MSDPKSRAAAALSAAGGDALLALEVALGRVEELEGLRALVLRVDAEMEHAPDCFVLLAEGVPDDLCSCPILDVERVAARIRAGVGHV